jgi:hypothetical protein
MRDPVEDAVAEVVDEGFREHCARTEQRARTQPQERRARRSRGHARQRDGDEHERDDGRGGEQPRAVRRDRDPFGGRDHVEEDGHTDGEHARGDPARAADVAVVDRAAEKQRQQQRGRENRLHQHERADAERERLEHVAAHIGTDAHDPTRPVRELAQDPELERLVLGKLLGFLGLQHIAQPVREGGRDGTHNREAHVARGQLGADQLRHGAAG